MRYIDTTELLSKRSSWGNSAELWKDSKLKKDFKAFFHSKCWYSEADLAMNDMHIDHFRPQNAVIQYKDYEYNEPLQNMGYYWLKNDANNYRACCAFSNRKTGEGGKGCYFPLEIGSPRLTESGSEEERPLLLDPCNADDVKIISFSGKDVICVSNDEGANERVEVSKVIYNLIDPIVTDRRSKVWEAVSKIIAEYEAGETTATVCIRHLADLTSRARPYSACAIACVNSLAPEEIKEHLDLNL